MMPHGRPGRPAGAFLGPNSAGNAAGHAEPEPLDPRAAIPPPARRAAGPATRRWDRPGPGRQPGVGPRPVPETAPSGLLPDPDQPSGRPPCDRPAPDPA